MTSFRSHMRAGRRKLHAAMGDSALYFPWPLDGAEPTPCKVRVHEFFTALGQQKGTSFQSAEVADESPSAVFYLDEIDPRRNYCFTLSTGAAYRIDSVEPPDDETITVNIVRLLDEEAVGMPVPEE